MDEGSFYQSPAIFCEMSGVSSLLPGGLMCVTGTARGETENTPWMSVTGLVSASLLLTSVLLVAVCVCCRRTKGFQVGRVSRHDETDALIRVPLDAGERQYETNWSVNADFRRTRSMLAQQAEFV
uniref:Uncharacterized protein n=1 Tax=Timema monikensis TaxID=170555 RepID=A0A7R9HQI3_9NEOP|nr:unnamed protein product [Timema monikensis]